MNASKVASSIGSFIGGGIATWFLSSYVPKLNNPHANSTLQRGAIGVGVAACSGVYYINTQSTNAIGFTLGSLAYTAFDTYTAHKHTQALEAELLENLGG